MGRRAGEISANKTLAAEATLFYPRRHDSVTCEPAGTDSLSALPSAHQRRKTLKEKEAAKKELCMQSHSTGEQERRRDRKMSSERSF